MDPITAIALATTAFNAIKKCVEAGKELEDTAQQLGKWYGAVADFRRAEQQNKNTPAVQKAI